MFNTPHSGCCPNTSRYLPGFSARSSRPCVLVYAENSPVKGARVRVTESVVVYHVPKTDTLDLKGWEGIVTADSRQVKGKDLSATFPWVVRFERPEDVKPKTFLAHLRDDEIEIIG